VLNLRLYYSALCKIQSHREVSKQASKVYYTAQRRITTSKAFSVLVTRQDTCLIRWFWKQDSGRAVSESICSKRQQLVKLLLRICLLIG